MEDAVTHHLRAIVLLPGALARVLDRILHGDEAALVLRVRVRMLRSDLVAAEVR